MRSSYRLAAIVNLILLVPLAIVDAVERVVAFAFALLPTFAAEPRLAVEGPALAFDTPGVSNDPALLNSLRHEAGMRRLN